MKETLAINPVLRYHPVTVSIYPFILNMVKGEVFADKIFEDEFVLVLGKETQSQNIEVLKSR